MKKRLIATILLALTFAAFTVGCDKKPSPNSKFDFSLKYGIMWKNCIDTYEGKLTKDLVEDGTKTVDFKIPKEDKKAILEKLLEYKINEMPESIDIEGTFISPTYMYELTYSIDGEKKTVSFNSGYSYTAYEDESLPQQNRDFLRFMKEIEEYVQNTEEYKSLPEAKGSYD